MYNFGMRNKFFSAVLFLVFLLGFVPVALAEKINSYDVRVTAQKDGKMDIVETINYDFESLSRHGIFRYIPLYSKVGDLYRIININNVSVERDGKEEKFEASKSKEQVYFKIGHADRTISGQHIYKISYTVENGMGSNYETHDEIYWNATGNDWLVPIEKATIKFDTDFGAKQLELICFTGVSGSTDKNCNVLAGSVTTLGTINPGEGFTAVVKYPKNTFPPSLLVKALPKTFAEKIGEFILRNIIFIYIGLNIILPVVLFYWYQKKKNKKRFGSPAVNFEIPKDERGERLAPALAGTIDTAKLERDDVTATLFDLAIRKYIRLEETKKPSKILGAFGKKDTDQFVVKLKENDGKLNTYEKELFDRLFLTGDKVNVETLRKDFYKTYQDMEEKVFKDLVDRKYFVKNPKAQRAFLFIFGFIALFTANIILSGMLIFLSIKLIGRTALGDEIDFKIDGLKLFLKSMDRNYKWQAEKFYTVEQMIPYAMSLGYVDKFMEQLKIINPDYNPTWYRGYSGSFYGAYAGFYTSVNSNMTTSAPSSSSGFSGGSSGGGGGGGGGGSW